MANKLEFELKLNVNMKVEEVRLILEKTFKMPVSVSDAQIVLERLLIAKSTAKEDIRFICPSCKETFIHAWLTCPNCKDSKIVPVCEKCKGSGVDPDNTELYCEDCGGDGKLPMRPYAAVKQMSAIYKLWKKGELPNGKK
ncbi:MAG: hypothetical protein J0M11_01425 [Anaerolineae bacterium]|nr:hypothetical protein [Anaerolineae bacterium]